MLKEIEIKNLRFYQATVNRQYSFILLYNFISIHFNKC